MAFRRSITTRCKLLHQHHQRLATPFSHSHLNDGDDDRENNKPVSKNPNYTPNLIHRRLFGAPSAFRRPTDRRFLIPSAAAAMCGGPVFARNMSSLGDGQADRIEEAMTDMADVFVDKAADVASQAGPVANEVAIAAADSYLPVAALQYLIDYVQCYTGLNWWASIVVTTLLIRWIQLPVMINSVKSSSKFALLRPRLEEIKEEMQNRGMSPAAVAEGQAQMKKLFTEYGVTPFSPLKGLFITGPIFCCFFFAIRNMAENVASFKEGGALWFTDLTTPDSTYIFPVLTALTFWITVECNSQEGMEGNPTANTIKNVSRVFAALTIPLTATFPKAIFCYWITSNLFSLAYGLALKKPEVRNFLGIPIISETPRPDFSFSNALHKHEDTQQQQSLSSPFEASSKPANHKISATSVLSQRIRSLEKEAKGRKKEKKR